MLVRVLSSICALVTAAAGVLLMDCEWSFLGVDSIGVCSTVESFGLSQTAYVGIGLACFAFIALIASWLPNKDPEEDEQEGREESLLRNIGRISDVGSWSASADVDESDDAVVVEVELDENVSEVGSR